MAEKKDEEKLEDTLGFDPSLKKKKKKKKVRIEGGDEPDEVEAVTEAVAEVTVQEKEKEKVEEPAEEITGDIDLNKKKKKKKPVAEDKPAEPEPVARSKVPSKEAATPAPAPAPAAAAAAGSDDEHDQDQEDDIPVEGEDDVVFEDGDATSEIATKIGVSSSLAGPLPWANSDRDYTYEELLGRVMDTLREKNPELSGEKKRFVMKPPHVVREGSKKTTFINFMEICKIMRRNPEHVYQFIMAELGTSGSIDGTSRMIIKGRFQPKAVENIIRRYVVEYVTCHSCKSPDTVLQKDNRLFFLLCNQCGAQRSVASIKTGFVAQVGKRKKV